MQPTIESTYKNQQLTVRPALMAELGEIDKLRRHDKVAPFQYRAPHDHADRLKAIMEMNRRNEPAVPTMQFYSVLLEDEFIGSITVCCQFGIQRIMEPGTVDRPLTIGWDLHPDHWGKGFMFKALEMLFGDFFLHNENLIVRAECFDFNDRCVRLLERLGFSQKKLSWLRHLFLRIERSSFHRHLRFELTIEEFKNRPVINQN